MPVEDVVIHVAGEVVDEASSVRVDKSWHWALTRSLRLIDQLQVATEFGDLGDQVVEIRPFENGSHCQDVVRVREHRVDPCSPHLVHLAGDCPRGSEEGPVIVVAEGLRQTLEGKNPAAVPACRQMADVS